MEDEHVLRMTFQQFLEEEGYAVAAAEGYDEALSLLEDDTYDVVVTDIILGGKTGIDLLRTIQQHETNCQVVMITGDPSVDTASEAVRLGAFDYLPKPVTGPAIRKVIKLALDRNELARERDRYAAQIDQARRELETIFNSVDEGIVTVDAALRVAHVNEAARTILELPEGPLGGERLAALFPDELAPASKALEETVTSREPTKDIRLEVALGNGHPKVLRVSTAPLVDEGDITVEPGREVARLLRSPGVWGDDDRVVELQREEVLGDQRHRVQLVDRDVEEALDLPGVQVRRQHAVGARHLDEVREQAGGDRDVRLVLLVGTAVGEVGDHGGHAAGGGALRRVDHDQQLHDARVHVADHRLHDEDIAFAHVLEEADEGVLVRELEDLDLAERDFEMLADRFSERRVGVAGKDRQLLHNGAPWSLARGGQRLGRRGGDGNTGLSLARAGGGGRRTRGARSVYNVPPRRPFRSRAPRC
ncbi:MAG: response regulator [Chloroflexi bacterium]|nr:response regulator [Chloroflexota bacterium]